MLEHVGKQEKSSNNSLKSFVIGLAQNTRIISFMISSLLVEKSMDTYMYY